MGRKPNGQFEKGTSGNPTGRPKRSDMEIELIQQICTLAPQAFNALKNLIESDFTPENIRFRCCELVIDRICGKSMSAFDLRDYDAPPPVKQKKDELWDTLTEQMLEDMISK